ncbi:MAG: serine hydrolase [Candidatus Aminicenantes bacterium]|nr:serine hydrolase [Candidatus Aminicenantes bacterium]
MKENLLIRLRNKNCFRPLTFFFLFALLLSFPLRVGAEGGLPLTRVLTVEEKQILYQLRQEGWEANSRQILQKIAGFRGEAGIMVKDLQTGWTFLHNEDQVFPAASLIKIPIMVACFKAVQEGRIKLEEKYVLKRKDRVGGSGILRRMRNGRTFTYAELINFMVTHSDNIATNVLIDRLGFDYINQVMAELGLKTTRLRRKMIDFTARENGLENYTTTKEITRVLEMIYWGKCYTPEISAQCLEVLKQQRINDRLPRFLPREAQVAHKTGLEREVCHDAGIVFTSYGDYVISILVRTWSGPRTTKAFIARLSSYFYQVFKT